MTFPGTPLIIVNITPEAIAGITTTLIGITQLAKWAGLDAKHAPPVLAASSLGIILIWVFMPSLYQILVAASLVMMGASGVYGFATRTTPPKGATPSDPAEPPAPVATPSAPAAPEPVQPVSLPDNAMRDAGHVQLGTPPTEEPLKENP